jgi:hypothetical protein
MIVDEIGDLHSRELTLEADELERELYAEATAAADAPELRAVDDSPAWWEVAYPGGSPVGPSTLIRALYYSGNPSGKPASPDGPDVLAVKRAVWRGGRWEGPASRFDDAFSRGFALGVGGNVVQTGLAGFQRQMRLDATGQMGEATYQALRYAHVPVGLPHAGEPLFDATAVELLEQAAARDWNADAGDVQAAIADYCKRSIAETAKIHYQQARPIACFGVPPEQGFTTDCSGHSTCAYYWARKVTGIAVPDPNGRGFDGYGYTGTLLNNPEATGAYDIGDLAIYGPSYSASSHVVTCYAGGNASSSRWCSHGSEAAPYEVALGYRSDLLEVVRPRLVP